MLGSQGTFCGQLLLTTIEFQSCTYKLRMSTSVNLPPAAAAAGDADGDADEDDAAEDDAAEASAFSVIVGGIDIDIEAISRRPYSAGMAATRGATATRPLSMDVMLGIVMN